MVRMRDTLRKNYYWKACIQEMVEVYWKIVKEKVQMNLVFKLDGVICKNEE